MLQSFLGCGEKIWESSLVFWQVLCFFCFCLFWPPRQHVELPPTQDGNPPGVLTTGPPRKSVIFGFDELYPLQPAEGSAAFQRGQSEPY